MAKKPQDVGYKIYKDFLPECLTEITRPCTLAAQCRMINAGLQTGKLDYLGIEIEGETYWVQSLTPEGENSILVRTQQGPRAPVLEHRVAATTTAWRTRSKRLSEAFDSWFSRD